MKNKSSLPRLISLVLLLGLLAVPAHAQFKKFESKFEDQQKKGTQPKKQSPPPKNKMNIKVGDQLKVFKNDEEDNDRNTFGSRINPLQGKPKDDKYVNLNPETGFGPEIITSFDFPDTDILELTKHMQNLTGMNLILDKDVKGKVSITAPTPITVGDAWKAYLTALDMAGFSIIKSGAFYRIISSRDLRYVPTKMYTGSYTPNTDAYVMKVIALKHVDAQEISRNFRPFLSRNGRMMEIKQTNTIIISDSGNHINRLEKLIKFVDIPGHDESLQIIAVKNSSAQEIAKLLDEILSASGSTSSSARSRTRSSNRSSRFSSNSSKGSQNISKIIAEPRTNSIIAMANAEGARQLRELIEKLDVERISNSSNRVHVYYLNFGNAEEMAKTLTNLVSGQTAADNGNANARKFVPSTQDAADPIFNSEVKVTADKDNNAIVVTATPTDWLTLKDVLDKLDIPRDQVYVEGLILETAVQVSNSFGINWVAATGKGQAQRIGFSPGGIQGDLASGLTNPLSLSGFFGFGGPEKSPKTVTIGGTDMQLNSVNGFIQAIATHKDSNVLATPQLLAMDNTEAEFEAGSTVPVPTTTSSASSNTTTSGIGSQEAKLVLRIKPQINKASRFVKLEITQQVDSFIGSVEEAGTAGLPTTTRSAQTQVMVRDRDTIAMGGLLQDREDITHSKIPLLGDIPVLGWLFKSKSKSIEKTNLIFFLTPTIISPYDNVASEKTLDVIKEHNKAMAKIKKAGDKVSAKDIKLKELKTKIERQGEGPLFDVTKLKNDSLSKEEMAKRKAEEDQKESLE